MAMKPGVVKHSIVPAGGVQPASKREPIRLNKAQVEADMNSLLPGHRLGNVVAITSRYGGDTCWIEFADDNYIGVKSSASGDDPVSMQRYYGPPHDDEWMNHCLTALFKYLGGLVTWPMSESAKPLPPTAVWPKPLAHELFQICFMSRALAPCKKFIELGADIKQYIIQRYGVGARTTVPDDRRGANSLHYCCVNAYLEGMKFIKDNGFWNVVQDDQEGRTLLHDLMDGSYNGENPKVRLQMLDMIVSDPGCDVNAKNEKGDTPLLVLLMSDNWQLPLRLEMMTGFLQRCNVDIKVVGSLGYSALDLVIRAKWPKFTAQLENYKGATAKPAAAPAPAPAGKPAPVTAKAPAAVPPPPMGSKGPPPPPMGKAPPAPATASKPVSTVTTTSSSEDTESELLKLKRQVNVLSLIVVEMSDLLSARGISSGDLNQYLHELTKNQ